MITDLEIEEAAEKHDQNECDDMRCSGFSIPFEEGARWARETILERVSEGFDEWFTKDRREFEASEPATYTDSDEWLMKKGWQAATIAANKARDEFIKELKLLMSKELEISAKQLSDRDATIRELKKLIVKYEDLIQYTYDACLCERFKTYGFDYHEEHPVLGNKGGTRSNTPRACIEGTIGFEWKYEKPEGACRSWRELKFKKFNLDSNEGR